jgi:hypothetical protein
VIGKEPFKPCTNSKQTVTQHLSKKKLRTTRNIRNMTINPEQLPGPATLYCGLSRANYNKVKKRRNEILSVKSTVKTRHDTPLHTQQMVRDQMRSTGRERPEVEAELNAAYEAQRVSKSKLFFI